MLDDTTNQPQQFSAPPYPYFKRSDGIYLIKASDDGEDTETWLSSDISMLGDGRDASAQNWGRIIDVVDLDGTSHRLFMTMADLASSPSKVFGRLSDHGLRFARGKMARDGILDLLSRWETQNRFLVTNKTGWASRACDAFVLDSSRIIGNPKVHFIGDTTKSSLGSALRGDIDAWKSEVAQRCVGNPILIASVSLAFCGPLLDVLGVDSFGLHLRGSSSSGKSTALNTAISVWGGPERMSSWRTTANALEPTAASMNSTLLALDELGQVSGKDAFDAAYTLGNGQGKRRANAAGRGTLPLSWRVPVLSSGEITLAEKIAESGQKAMTGQEVRIIDVAADIGRFGAFEDIHGAASPAQFAENLKASAKNTYGVAGPLFVENCLSRSGNLKPVLDNQVAALAKHFLGRLTEPVGGPIQRVAASFALTAAAGELASLWGLTGWPKRSAIEAVGQLFEAWVDRHMAVTNSAELVWLPKLDTFLEGAIGYGICAANASAVQNDFGFWTDTFVFLNDRAWSEAFGATNQHEATKALAEHGVLVKDGKHFKTKTPRSVGTRERLYRLRTTLLGAEVRRQMDTSENSSHEPTI